MRKSIFLLSILVSLFLFTRLAEAKLLPQVKGAGQKSVVKSGVVTGISVYPKLRSDRKALIVNFANLQNAISVSYLLTYKSSIQDEGAMGTLPMGGSSSTSVELLFGTCSKNVCRYHTGIKDARLDVTYVSKNGKKYLKRYKIKV